ncbi:phytoene desaturase family protein [Hyphococcus lacteus]|uniref:Pyridine nucleotide-disulfide oxidoreductase domain-containing protein 2 n=1 Tax=Hyphococcus lacteus TaxID=3143536 RepID=A0ABV3Z014_9PROT
MSDNADEHMVMPDDERLPGRIEGGIDAIVIGAGADGLAAAAYLGRAGLKTVLVGAGKEIGGKVAVREIAPDVPVVDGEHLVTVLDPDVVAELDLYRHGLEYAARRLDTTYYFDDGEVLRFDGDLAQAALLSLDDDADRERLETFMSEMLEIADRLRPAFNMSVFAEKDGDRRLEKILASLPTEVSERIDRVLFGTADNILRARLGDTRLRALLLSEASFRSGVPPFEAFSFMSLIRRYAGEAAGLQGAVAYPKGGVMSVITALRRAAQLAKVDVRAATPVRSILIEGDRVAGVTLKDGGQLRANIVVAAIDAKQAYMDMIGPKLIDIELQRMLSVSQSDIGSARLHLLLKGVAQDDATRKNMTRRLVFTPTPEELSAAFMDARAGRIPEKLIIEAIFPTALDQERSLEKRQLMSVMAHPLPFDKTPDEVRREEIKKALLSNIEIFASDLSERIEAVDLRLPADDAKNTGATAQSYASKPDIIQQWATARTVTSAAKIGGFYFCGPEAQIGGGISCSAGRAAAKTALRDYKRGAP